MCLGHRMQRPPCVWVPIANDTPRKNSMRQNGSGGGKAGAIKARDDLLRRCSFTTVRFVCPTMWLIPRLARLVLKAFVVVALQGINARAIVLDFYQCKPDSRSVQGGGRAHLEYSVLACSDHTSGIPRTKRAPQCVRSATPLTSYTIRWMTRWLV